VTPISFYLGTTDEFERSIGRWTKKPRAKTRDPERRLGMSHGLWEDRVDLIDPIVQLMEHLKVRSTLNLYHRILDYCQPDTLASTYTS